MDIKIPTGPPGGDSVDAIKDAAEASESSSEASEVSSLSPESLDSISLIAEQVARGEIDRNEAVERILGDVMDSDMIQAAPDELKQELNEVLTSLLETDPYLKSLVAAIGPTSDK